MACMNCIVSEVINELLATEGIRDMGYDIACGHCEKCRDEIKRMRQDITTKPSPKGIWYGLAMMVDNPQIISPNYPQMYMAAVRQMELADVVITQDEVLKNRSGYRGKIFGDHICKGSVARGTGCGFCSSCLEQLKERSDRLTKLESERHYTRDEVVKIVDDVVVNVLRDLDITEPDEYTGWAHVRLEREWDFEFEKEEEETITVTYSIIKATCGWSEFADQCKYNPWAPNEFGIEDHENFTISKSDAIALGIIRG